MTIYFYTSSDANNNEAKSILDCLKKSGSQVISNLLPQSQYKEMALDNVSALVLQGDDLDDQSNYFIALALAQSKPVLCLLAKQSAANKIFETLKTNKNFQEQVRVVFYQPNNLQKKVLDFLKELDSQTGQTVANIKYTLRISPKISEYLAWKTDKANRRKADWVRNTLLEVMENDEKYQKHLKNKFSAK